MRHVKKAYKVPRGARGVTKFDGSHETDQIPSVIRQDAADKFIYNDIRKNSENLKQVVSNAPNRALADSALRDVFASLYKLNPEVDPNTNTSVRPVIEQMMRLPEYQRLSADTRLDDMASALGMISLGPDVLEQIQVVQEQRRENQKKSQAEKEETDQGQEREGDGQEQGSNGGAELTDEQEASLRKGLREALSRAAEQTEKLQEVLRGWGYQPGDLATLSPSRRLELAEMLLQQKDFQSISELIGRFQHVVAAEKATTYQHGQDEIVDIETGDDISRLLPSELLKLKAAPALFFKDYLEKNLLQYKMQGTENMGRGPIVCCVDDSGSMHGAPAEWAKAAFLTLMNICEQQKRSFGAITFTTEVHYQKFWKRGTRIPLEDRLEFINQKPSGGTDFNAPLREALKMIASEPELRPSDICFVTDGDSDVSPAVLEEIRQAKAKGLRIYAIVIGNRAPPVMKEFADSISVLSFQGGDRYQLEDVKELVQGVMSAKPPTQP